MEYHYLILFFMVGKLAMVSGNEKDLAPVKLDHSNFIQLALGLNINLDALKERQSGSVNSILGDPDTPLSPLYRDSCDGLSGIFCQDCSTLMLCQNSANPLYSSSCPSATPYCTAEGCSSTTNDVQCQAAKYPYKCSSEGYFPDPTNCTKFFYCPGPDSSTDSIIVYSCPAGFTFSTVTNNCRKTASSSKCQPFNCAKKSNQFVHYQSNPAYYGLCTEESASTSMVVFKCPDTKNMAYDLSTYRCDFQCKAEGYFADTLDSKKYYFCYISNRVYTYSHESCPTGYSFKVDQCVKD